MDDSLISIIVHIYNSEECLNECLNSIINQTYNNLEIICINDGSTDGSLKILKEYKQKDNRIKIINIKNRGISFSRNIGIKESIGKFIVFVDGNDYINLEFCENLLNNQKKTYADLVCGKKDELEQKLSTIDNKISDKLFKSDIVKKYNLLFDTTIQYASDSLFLTQYLVHCKIVSYLNDSNYITQSNYNQLNTNPTLIISKNAKVIETRKEEEKPLVSIILTLYEIKPEYLNECLKSILKQTYSNIEVIAINDCSPRTNYDYISKMSKKIKLYKNEVNLGMNKTVNKAFKLAKGKYIMRLGSDDYYSPELVEKEVDVLENDPTIGATCCELQRFGNKDQYIKRPKEWDLKKILDGDYRGTGYAGGMMFRASLLDYCTINENYRMCEDFDFHLQILEHMPIKSIHEVMYFYRAHETNICKTVPNKDRVSFLKQILKEHNEIYNQNHQNI